MYFLQFNIYLLHAGQCLLVLHCPGWMCLHQLYHLVDITKSNFNILRNWQNKLPFDSPRAAIEELG